VLFLIILCLGSTEIGEFCAGGNHKIVQMVKDLEVYGGESGIGAMNHRVKHQDKFKVGSLEVTALSTPCHTSGHICYYIASDQGT